MKLNSVFLFLCVLCVSAVAFAQSPGSATDLPQKGLNPQTVILIAGMVSGGVELLKRLFKFQGRISVAVNVVAAIAAIYAAAPPESIFSIAFLLTALQSVLTSAGVFATVSTVKGG